MATGTTDESECECNIPVQVATEIVPIKAGAAVLLVIICATLAICV